jgi:hypothetical protein
MKISIKLTFAFILLAFGPILIIGWISYDKGKSSLEAEAFNRLTAVREMKASQIDAYFGQIHDQVLTLSEDPTIAEAMRQFKDGFANVQNDLCKTPEELAQHTINVKAYFDDVYMKELLPNLDSMDEQVHDMPTDDVQALLLQDLYIAPTYRTLVPSTSSTMRATAACTPRRTKSTIPSLKTTSISLAITTFS